VSCGVFVCGTGFVLQFGLYGERDSLHLPQHHEDTLIFVMQTRLIAIQQAKGGPGIGEILECERDELGAGSFAALVPTILPVHVLVDEPRLDSGEAGDTPGDGGELINEVERGLIAGLELFDIGAQMGVEFLGGFGGKDDRLSRESVSDGVARRGP
jgi:hypothetical protein